MSKLNFNFRALSISLITLFCLSVISCSKTGLPETTSSGTEGSVRSSSNIPTIAQSAQPTTFYPVYLSSGNYISTFGSGISFGGAFPYPLNVTPGQTGTLYYPSVSGLTNNGGHYGAVGFVSGAYISYTYPTMSVLSVNQHSIITNYQTAMNNFVTQARNPDGTLKQSTLPGPPAGINSGGAVTITGTFILDAANASTHVSIVNGYLPIAIPPVGPIE